MKKILGLLMILLSLQITRGVMKKFIIPISVGLVLLSSCSRNTVRNTQADDFIDRCSVVKTGEKIFPVDDNTSTNFDYLQYIHNDTLPMLSLLNTYSNSIYLYVKIGRSALPRWKNCKKI